MLAFFPTPYPDEILYSTFARYHVWSKNLGPKMTMQDLFGISSVISTLDFPTRLGNLIDRMIPGAPFSFEQLVNEHTLYPFYAPFFGSERAHKILKSMQYGKGGDIHALAGILASSVKVPDSLRFCPQCYQEDLVKYGEPYWHRIHQVPCAVVCLKHKCIVQNSRVLLRNENRHGYLAANNDNCVPEAHSGFFTEELKNKIQNYIEDCSYLLSNSIEVQDLNWYRDRYLNKLKEIGLATANGTVYINEAVDYFSAYYGEEFLNLLQSPVWSGNSWFEAIFRRHRKAFHPVRHLLIIRFLYGSANEFFGMENDVYMPFGPAPYMCLNAASDHYKQRVVNDLQISYCPDTKRPIGQFSCDCGFVYTRRGPDKEDDDAFKIGRIKNFGPVWENLLRQLIDSQPQLSLREIARRLNVDPGTVKKYSSKLVDLQNTATSETGKEVYKNTQLNSKREKWLELTCDYQGLTKTELRQQNPGLFTWLYRNDREWLNSNSPLSNKPNCCRKQTVDWQSRDQEILEKLKIEVARILDSNTKPERMSATKLGKRCGCQALLEKHIDKLPLTKDFLGNTVDTIETYQLRRVKWAIRKLNEQSEEISRSKVMRLAGLKSAFMDKYEPLLWEGETESHFNLGEFVKN